MQENMAQKMPDKVVGFVTNNKQSVICFNTRQNISHFL